MLGNRDLRMWPVIAPTMTYSVAVATRNQAARKCRLRAQPFWLKMSKTRTALTGEFEPAKNGTLGAQPPCWKFLLIGSSIRAGVRSFPTDPQ